MSSLFREKHSRAASVGMILAGLGALPGALLVGCARGRAVDPGSASRAGADSRASSDSGMPPGHASFKLSPMREQLIGVRYGAVEKKEVFKKIHATGSLAFDPELYMAQNEYLEALQELERVKDSPLPDVKRSARKMVDSARVRLRILGLSDPQINGLASSGNTGSNLLLNRRGENAWVYAEVYEMDLPYVRPGLTATITASFLGGKILTGKVIAVDNVINPSTRTARARIRVQDPRTLLRPDSYVEVTMDSPLGERLVVPFDAVLDTGEHAWAFVTDGKGRFTPREIAIAFRAGDQVAVASGLGEGEKIVTSANFLIDSESRLKAAAKPSAPAGAARPAQPSLPACPAGQHWDTPMAMCMPGAG